MMLNGPSEEAVCADLHTFKDYLHQAAEQLPFTRSKTQPHLSSFWASSGLLNAEKFPQQLLTIKLPTTLRQAQHVLGLLIFWRQHTTHFSLILHTIYAITLSLPPFGSCPAGSPTILTFSPLWLHIPSLVLGHT